MNNFVDGIEHIEKKITKIDEEIENLVFLKNGLFEKKDDLESKLSKIDHIENSLLLFYEIMYKLSKFHENNYLFILEVFENELKSLNSKFYDMKINIYKQNNTSNYEQILNNYSFEKKTLIENFFNKIKSELPEINVILKCILNLKDLEVNLFKELATSEHLYKIINCHIYIDLIVWNPFYYKKFSDENINSIKLLNEYEDTFISNNCFKWLSYIQKILFDDELVISSNIFVDLQNKINDNIVNKYICEIIKLYWVPIYALETSNLICSIYELDRTLNFIKKIEHIITEKFYNSFNDFFINVDFKLYDEYQLVNNLITWNISLYLFKTKFNLNSIKKLINETIASYISKIDSIYSNSNIKHILLNIKINLSKLINFFKNPEIYADINLFERLKENNVVLYCNDLEGLINEKIIYVYKNINDNFINYKLNYLDEYFSIIEIINFILK